MALADLWVIINKRTGPQVRKIQAALVYLDNLSIDQSEIDTGFYGPSTAAAVLAFKKARHIINHAYQTQEDDIVGMMTIAAMDRELRDRQIVPA
jgi:peptidoglycan hydrolase-like protein with peptidoglycan-binding domain